MFNNPISKETVNNGNSFFHPGINEPVYLKELKREPLKEGRDNVTTITFINDEGAEFKHIKFDVNEERVRQNAIDYPKIHKKSNKEKGFTEGYPVTPDQAVLIEEGKYNTFIYCLVKTYVAEELIYINPKSFDDLINQANNLIKGKYEGVPVRLKVVYNYNNFYDLPYFGYIEPVTVKPPKVVITSFDKIVKSNSEPIPQQHPADVSSDDLPF